MILPQPKRCRAALATALHNDAKRGLPGLADRGAKNEGQGLKADTSTLQHLAFSF